MFLREASFRHFRNVRRADLELPDGPLLFWGDNAQGKTALLEGLYYLATGRSFRTRNDRECVAWDAPDDEPTVAQARVQRAEISRDLKLVLFQGEKRLIMDGAPLARLGELFGCLTVVLFTPSDLAIAQGGPAVRRRFLDLDISQADPGCLAALQRYAQALRQRNALLRDERPLSALTAMFASYEQLMAEAAVEIYFARRAALDDLGPGAARIYQEFGGGERLAIQYRHFLRGQEGDHTPTLADAFRRRLEADRAEDRRRGATGSGPHRDDFALLLDGRLAQDFASQGQQRSCALALRIAEVGWMRERTGESPVLLMDDLASELDPGRRERLLTLLSAQGGQALLTTTRRDDFPRGMDFAGVWNVAAGAVRRDA